MLDSDTDDNKKGENLQDGKGVEKDTHTCFPPNFHPTNRPKKEGYYTTNDVAQNIGVTRKTVEYWRKQNLFVEDILDHNGVYWYSKERVEQLKSVYRRDWQHAWAYSEEENLKDANDYLQANKTSKLANFTRKATKKASSHFSKKAASIPQNQKSPRDDEKVKSDLTRLANERLATVADADFLQIMFHTPLTDYGNAEKLNKLFGEFLHYVYDLDHWYYYQDGIWKKAGSKNSLLYPIWSAIVKRFSACRPKFNYTRNSSGGLSLDNSKPQANNLEEAGSSDKIDKKIQERKTAANAIEMLIGAAGISIESKYFDKNPMLLNVKNGVIDLETGKFFPHNPNQLFTKQCNVVYNPAARAPLFEQFMKEILPDEETRASMLRYFGYCLTGLVNEESVYFAFGKGGNGKGTLFGTIQYLLGDYATSYKMENLLKRKFGNNPEAASPEKAKLNGARFAVASESKDVRQFDTAELKDLTGGDFITARAMYQSPVTFKPTFKLMLQGNVLPTPENIRDEGFLRRIEVIKFEQNFTKNPNKHLKEDLISDESLSGILNILIAECVKWYEQIKQGKSGLIISAAMKAAKAEYISDNDFIANFIAENCELDSAGFILRKEFLKRLREETKTSPFQYKDKELVEMITAIDGITEKSEYEGRAKCFCGVKWLESENGEPLNM